MNQWLSIVIKMFRTNKNMTTETKELQNYKADRINRENKTCIIMGDFNIDLLKFESHSATDGFLNTLGSNFFQPYILQPTRITDHSATLIDNIF